MATAFHNLWEAMDLDWRGRQVRAQREIPSSLDLAEVGLAVLWQQVDGDRGRAMLWSLETAEAALPTDVAFSFPSFQTTHPFRPFPIGFSLPSEGERVYCIGCFDEGARASSFSEETISRGRMLDHFDPRLMVVEARVTSVFTQHFARGFVDGPCFLVDADLPHGMSGGPVFDEEGFVRGVVTAGSAQIFGTSSSIISLLYPAFLSSMRFGVQIGPVRINASRPLVELIAEGYIATDGSETRVTIQWDDEGAIIGIAHPKGNVQHIFDNLAGLQDTIPGTRASGATYHIKYREEPSS